MHVYLREEKNLSLSLLLRFLVAPSNLSAYALTARRSRLVTRRKRASAKSESPGVNFLLDKHHNSRRQICRRNSCIPKSRTRASTNRPLRGKYLPVLSKQYRVRSRGSNKTGFRPGAAPVKLEKQRAEGIIQGMKRKDLLRDANEIIS